MQVVDGVGVGLAGQLVTSYFDTVSGRLKQLGQRRVEQSRKVETYRTARGDGDLDRLGEGVLTTAVGWWRGPLGSVGAGGESGEDD